jgi:uncharacterized membrane protein YkoI
MKRQLMSLAIAIGSIAVGSLPAASNLGAEAKHEMIRERNNRHAADESQDQSELARQAKITKEQAQEIALKRAPGTVESGELEREHGKLVYSFDIRNAKGTIDEVQVSAITSKVVRVEHESKKQEEAEKRKEAKEKKH